MKKTLCIVFIICVFYNVNFAQTNFTVSNNSTNVEILPSGVRYYRPATTNNEFNTALGRDALNASTSGQFNTALGISALSANSTGSQNIAIGHQALYLSSTSNNNIAVGFNALSTSLAGSNNIAIGNETLASSSGGYNIAIGVKSLTANTSGMGNVATGIESLYSNSTGILNMAYGNYTLHQNTTGMFNAAFGNMVLRYNTSGNYNVGLGNLALNSNTTGIGNVGVGGSALKSNTTANGNVGLGGETLMQNSTGSYNVAIGSQAGYNEVGSNKLYIENSSSSSPLIGGDFNNDIVGINMNVASLSSNPNDKLQVNGNARISGSINTSTIIFSSNITLTHAHFKLIYTGPGLQYITLPSALGITGREYLIINHGQGSLQTTPYSFKTGFSTTDQYLLPGNILHLVSDGTDWRKIN